MKKRTLSLIVQSIAAILPLTFSSAAVVAQTHELITLTDFGQTPTDGVYPSSPLVFDKAGNLYGVTPRGGVSDVGTVFELTKKPDGAWARKTLYRFAGGSDGAIPLGALVLDSAGNLYGTTKQGGVGITPLNPGYGLVFELSPNGDGSWTETVLYNFLGTPDGQSSRYGVIFDSAGNLYGTTLAGGAYGSGTIFKLTPEEGGGWKESVIHNFAVSDGIPSYGLAIDRTGNLYGTTSANSPSTSGVVFKLSPGSDGAWSYTILYAFPRLGSSGDGTDPESGVILDADGNLYGTTFHGGDNTYYSGAVFEVPAGQNGSDNILYSFYGGEIGDYGGWYPWGGLVFDHSGNLYGTTYFGGRYGGGKIFEMLPTGYGNWTVKTLHDFGGFSYNGFTAIDGYNPLASMILGPDGNLYGTTEFGGYHPGDPSNNGGVAFELKLH
jgi:uncharacterized repeat protein (TIGR03803 family)